MATQPSYSTRLASRAKVADELALLARQAQVIANASGAAIAACEAHHNEFFCRASSGPSAPDVGVPVPLEGTLTGACIQDGKELFCQEAEKDARVDAGAARALGIRSMLVMPIEQEGRVSGVLAVFSATPNDFTSAHVAGLKVLADQISAVLRKEHATTTEECPEPLIRPAPTVLKMVMPATAGDSAAPDFAPAFGRVLAVSLDQDKPGLASTRGRWLGAIQAVGAKLAKTGRNQLIVIATIAAILLVAVAILLLRRGNGNPVLALEHTRNVVPSPSQGPASEPVQPPDRSAGARSELSEQVVNNNNGLKDNQGEQPEETRQDQPAVVVPDLKTAERRLALPAEPQSEDVSPNLSLGRVSASDLRLLAQPANRPPVAMASASGLVKAKLIHVVRPVYPNIAKTTRISGPVVLQILVQRDGRVANPKFISGPLALRDSAFDAVKQWIFQPAMLHDQPVEQETRVTLRFQP